LLLNQPHSIQLGTILNDILDQNVHDYQTFYLIVAYVRESGVAHLRASIQKFRADGNQVKAVVGIDQQNTSVQGLQSLLSLCDELWVYHNERPIHTFHPKIYAFEKVDQKAALFVGSNNLTEGGLYTNYEASFYSEYDLTDAEQVKVFSEFKNMFDAYTTSALSLKMTPALIETLRKENYISDESRGFSFPQRRGGVTKRTPVFSTETFTAPSISRKPKPKQVTLRVGTPTPAIAGVKGGLLWVKKKLPSSDVQDVKIGTAPTGGLRLTQAGWKVGGAVIDQTTYFKANVFRGSSWRIAKAQPLVEVTDVLFDITILGKNVGQYRLQIRHKPSGEAGQGNYTTLISWGEVSKILRALKLKGKDFYLYGPPNGEKEPYFIEIK